MIKHECDLCNGKGNCTKYSGNHKCKPSTKDWFADGVYGENLNFIPVDTMCRKGSIFGNEYIALTQKDIDRIKNGEIIHIPGEYGTFIGFIEGEFK